MPMGVYKRPERFCEFPGCGRKHRINGLCESHNGQRRRGSELTPIFSTKRPNGEPPRIEYDEAPCSEHGLSQGLTTPCHISRATKTNGYGMVWIDDGKIHGRRKHTGRMIGVHVYVYQKEVGPITPGHDVDHICMVRGCCNPEHLRQVTQQISAIENSKTVSAINAAKTACIRGHEFTEENTLIGANGKGQPKRDCKICKRAYMRAYYLKHKATWKKKKKS